MDYGDAVATDPNTGNVIITGSLGGPVNFGAGPTASGGIFLAAYNSSGTNLWAKTFNSSMFPPYGSDAGYAVAVDGSGNIVLTGSAFSTINFGGGWDGPLSYFAASFTSSGTYRWCKGRTLSGGSSTGYAIAFTPLGQAVVAGAFSGTLDAGGVSLTATLGATAPFVAQYGP